jgi:hypothetical protein
MLQKIVLLSSSWLNSTLLSLMMHTTTYQKTQCHITKDSKPQPHCCRTSKIISICFITLYDVSYHWKKIISLIATNVNFFLKVFKQSALSM